MAKTKEGYVVPDGYVTDIIVASWDKQIKDFQVILIKRAKLNAEGNTNVEAEKFALPGGFVDVQNQETAIDAAKRELKEEVGIDIVMFRHIAVFDNPNRDPRGYIVSNVMLALVSDLNNIKLKAGDDAEEAKVFALNDILKKKLAFDHNEIISKFKKLIDYDIYSQIFDVGKFGSDFIISLLGNEFTTSELIDLAKWAGRKENKTTFYRNIDTNYKYLRKVGRNKYYTKK